MGLNRKRSPLIGREVIANDKRYIVIEVLGVDEESGRFVVSGCPIIKDGKLIQWRSPKMLTDYRITNKKRIETKSITGKGDQEVRYHCAEVNSD